MEQRKSSIQQLFPIEDTRFNKLLELIHETFAQEINNSVEKFGGISYGEVLKAVLVHAYTPEEEKITLVIFGSLITYYGFQKGDLTL